MQSKLVLPFKGEGECTGVCVKERETREREEINTSYVIMRKDEKAKIDPLSEEETPNVFLSLCKGSNISLKVG